MNYKIEIRWGRHDGNLNWSEKVGELTAEQAIKIVRDKANLSRIVCDVQAIANDRSHVIARYNPDDDMRLPGCRCCKQMRIANELLIKAGKPELVFESEEKTIWYIRACDKNSEYNKPEFDEIWNEAEKLLPDTDGFWAMENN